MEALKTAVDGKGTALERIPAGANQVATLRLNEIVAFAEHFAACSYFSDVRKASQAVVKIIAGQELGISPFAAMTGVYIIPSNNGNQVMIGSAIMSGKIKSSDRYDYDVVESSRNVVEIAFWRCKNKHGADHDLGHKNGCKLEGKVRITLDDMIENGVAIGKDGKPKRNWKGDNAEAMLFNRAISRGTKRFFPDLLMGGAFVVDAEVDEPIDVTSSARVIDDEISGRRVPRKASPLPGHEKSEPENEQDTAIVDGDRVDTRTGAVIEPEAAERAEQPTARTPEQPAADVATKATPEAAKRESIFNKRKPPETKTVEASKPQATPEAVTKAANENAKTVEGTATAKTTSDLSVELPPKPTYDEFKKSEAKELPPELESTTRKPAPGPEPNAAPPPPKEEKPSEAAVDMEAALVEASKVPDDVYVAVTDMKPEEEISREFWQKVHSWLISVAPAKDKKTWAMGMWDKVGMVKTGANTPNPKALQVRNLVRNVGMALLPKK